MKPPTRFLDALRSSRLPTSTIVFGVLLAVGILWAFWPALLTMVDRWATDTRYSHGFLVPLFAVALLWLRRDKLTAASPNPNWWGVALLAGGVVLKLTGGYYFVPWLEDVPFIPMLAGLLVLIGGWPWLRWAWPALLFLVFMVPLPYTIERMLGEPLQEIATLTSTFILQTIGLPAVSDGNIIHINEASIGVVEACNGLGMLVMFAAFATATVFVVERPLLDKAAILVSAVPIAVGANVLRITITGLLHATVGGPTADRFYHDMAGYFMMPLALGILWLELSLLSHLLIEPRPAQAVPVVIERGPSRR
jgi:exosortase